MALKAGDCLALGVPMSSGAMTFFVVRIFKCWKIVKLYRILTVDVGIWVGNRLYFGGFSQKKAVSDVKMGGLDYLARLLLCFSKC